MCSNTRIVIAGLAGYLIGGLTGSALASWLLMAVAGIAMFAWSRSRDRRAGGASCALPRASRMRLPAPLVRAEPLPAPPDRRDPDPDAAELVTTRPEE